MKKRGGVYKIRRVYKQVYLITNCEVNMVLIVGNEKALLFDTGYGFGDIKQAIREITDKPLKVVCSHGHLDHIGGNWQFEKVHLHEKDWQLAHLLQVKPIADWR